MRSLVLNFSTDSFAVLSDLQNQVGTTDAKHTINTALTLLKWAAKEIEEGREIASLAFDDSNDQRVPDMEFIRHIRKGLAKS